MKIGIMGGTFNPIHNGHIELALKAYDEYKLDKVWVMISPNPPHKKDQEILSIDERIAMVKLAIEDYSDKLIFSDYELDREGYVYTADTLTKLNEEYKDDEFYYIIGGDSLKNIETWYHPEIVLKKAVILACIRDSYGDEEVKKQVEYLNKKYDSDVRILHINNIPISSTHIREACEKDEKIANYVPAKVEHYIRMHHIYNAKIDLDTIRNDLINVLKPSRYKHTLGVEATSIALAMRYEVDLEKAQIAGLLHDCAKNISDEKQLEFCNKYGLEISPSEKEMPYLLHAKLGAYFAKNKYDISDTDILNAIENHTTGRENMSILEKIVFTADYIEPSRDKAPRLKEIRKMAFIDIDKAMLMIFEDTISYLKSKENSCIDEKTMKSYEYLKKHMKN